MSRKAGETKNLFRKWIFDLRKFDARKRKKRNSIGDGLLKKKRDIKSEKQLVLMEM